MLNSEDLSIHFLKPLSPHQENDGWFWILLLVKRKKKTEFQGREADPISEEKHNMWYLWEHSDTSDETDEKVAGIDGQARQMSPVWPLKSQG